MPFIGIDPDTKATGVCIWQPGSPPEMFLVRARGRLAADRFEGMARGLRSRLGMKYPGDVVVAIEWQHIRPRERNPNSIMGVQAVAGMALAAIAPVATEIHLPIPSKWRGTQRKEVMQERFLRQAGLDADSPEFHGIPGSMRTHVIDALGLVQWLYKGRK